MPNGIFQLYRTAQKSEEEKEEDDDEENDAICVLYVGSLFYVWAYLGPISQTVKVSREYLTISLFVKLGPCYFLFFCFFSHLTLIIRKKNIFFCLCECNNPHKN